MQKAVPLFDDSIVLHQRITNTYIEDLRCEARSLGCLKTGGSNY